MFFDKALCFSQAYSCSARQWPNLPYKVPVYHTPREDFGEITVTDIGDAGEQRQAAAFDAFTTKLAKQLIIYNKRFTAISMAEGARPVGSFLIDLTPEGYRGVPINYLSSLLRTVAGLVRRYSFRSLVTKNKAPFGDSHLGLDIRPDGFYIWTPPVFVDVPASDYIVQIQRFEFNIDLALGLSDWLATCVDELLYRSESAMFRSLTFGFERGGHRFHFAVDRSASQPSRRLLTNKEAYTALSNWRKWFSYVAENSHLYPLHSFDIVRAGASSASTTRVASGRVWLEGLDTFRGNASGTALEGQGSIHNTIEEVS